MKVVALTGGVGGSKLVNGLSQCLSPEDLSIIVNTGDDFSRYGLYICPDLDSVIYTLAGINNPATGWGRSGETWNVLNELKSLETEAWFNLGDKDIAFHLARTELLQNGKDLTQVTKLLSIAHSILYSILPMTNDVFRTFLLTNKYGSLTFQEYFVYHQCQPEITGVDFPDHQIARATKEVIDRLENCDIIVLCPSNPLVSINPIISLPGVIETFQNKVVVAVSPLVGGKTLKGPAAKMLTELGFQASSVQIAKLYQTFLSGILIDHADINDSADINHCGIISLVTDIVMRDIVDQTRLAEQVLTFSESLREDKTG